MTMGKRVTALLVLVALAAAWGVRPAPAAQLPDTGQTRCYDGSGEIPCPSPGQPFYGQDGNYLGPEPVYKVNKDGTVTDLRTGLTWQQADDGVTRNWNDAVSYCATLGLAGGGWRLPERNELAGIMNLGTVSPAVEPVFSSRSTLYWTNTTYAGSAGAAWSVGDGNGDSYFSNTGFTFYVLCVRSGP